MVNNIDGISGNRPSITNTGNKSRPEASDGQAPAANTQSAASTQPAASKPTAARTDEVSLTSSAQLLKELNDAVQAAPSNGQERVDSIRQALAEGTYEVDAGSIADKLLSLDQQL